MVDYIARLTIRVLEEVYNTQIKNMMYKINEKGGMGVTVLIIAIILIGGYFFFSSSSEDVVVEDQATAVVEVIEDSDETIIEDGEGDSIDDDATQDEEGATE